MGLGDMCVDEEVKVKNYVQHLSQISALINDLSGIRDLSPTGLLHSFEPGNKVLFKTWKIGFPESQLEQKWTEPWDVLLTTQMR